jgi:hypothetical protein
MELCLCKRREKNWAVYEKDMTAKVHHSHQEYIKKENKSGIPCINIGHFFKRKFEENTDLFAFEGR